MKIRSPSVGLQPVRTPDAEVRAVAPRSNPAAAAALQFGEGLQSAGQSIIRVEEVNQMRVSRARVKEADAKLADGYRKILAPADGGYRSLLGRAAVDGRETTQQALQKHRESILGTLTPEQRDMISASESSLYQQALGTVDGHYAHQLQAFEIGESSARAEQLLADTLDGYFAPQDPKAPARDPFAENRVSLRGELVELARLRGYGSEQTQQLLQHTDDNLHAAVVEKLNESGRAVEAAAHIEKFKDRLSPAVREKALASVREAGVVEQAETVASGLLSMPGTLTEKLDRLNAYREAKHVDTEVALRAERRLLQMSESRREDRVRGETEALADAMTWAQANRSSTLPEEKRRALGSRTAAFDLWALQGNQFITTGEGERRLARLTPQDLLQFESQAELVRAWETDLSPKDLRTVVLSWQKARGEVLNPKDAVSLDRTMQVKNYLTRANFYADNPAMVGDSDNFARRVGLFQEAVARRASKLAKGAEPTNDIWDIAIAEEFGNGRVLNGKWIPEVMLSPAENKEAVFTPLPYDTLNSEEDFVGYTRAGKPIPLVATEKLSAAAGGAAQVVGNVNQRLADGTEIRVAESTALPSAAEIRAELMRGGIANPSMSQIAAKSRLIEIDLQQKREAAQRIASLENRVRMQAALERLPDDIDREFVRRRGKELESWNAVRSLASAVQQRQAATLGLPSGVFPGNKPLPDLRSDRAPAASSDLRQELRAAGLPVESALQRGLSIDVTNPRPTEAVWREAAESVLGALRPQLEAQGLTLSDAMVYVPDAVRLLTRQGGRDPLYPTVELTDPQMQIAGRVGVDTAAAIVGGPVAARSVALTDAEKAELAELKQRYLITEKTK